MEKEFCQECGIELEENKTYSLNEDCKSCNLERQSILLDKECF